MTSPVHPNGTHDDAEAPAFGLLPSDFALDLDGAGVSMVEKAVMSPLLHFAFLCAALPLAAFPWSESVPAELVRDSVEPDTVAHETPCDWRPVLTPVAESLVRDCPTAREAVLRLAAELPKETGVFYSIERSKHNMNVLEALAEKKVSCTGQSVLLVCALRSVGIPARMVGVLTWNHIRGNHSWVEAWFEGDWHMIEYNERDFNTPWVMENIGMLDSGELSQRIQALTPAGTEPFIAAYAMDKTLLPAVDVSARYAALAREYYRRSGAREDEQRLMLDVEERPESTIHARVEDESGAVVSSAPLPTAQDDVRCMARLTLPREGRYFLRIGDEEERLPLQPTPAPVQILRLER